MDRLVITASGGPFRGRSAAELADVTVEEALKHPTWAMGGKITIDSATLMNKGLELIEAHHLFAMPYDRIDVVVHPQSIVHALVHLCDGASLAHLGYPDMRVPIAYALHHPERVDVAVPTLDLAEVGALTFEPVDTDTFACLRLAREAAAAGGTAPCVLNAANEVAVHAFLAGRLGFLGIADVIEATLERVPAGPVLAFDSLYEADAAARAAAARARGGALAGMSWFLAFAGFALLIILHEFGHFAAAKAGRHAGRALLAVLPAADPQVEAEELRDRVRDRGDPARGLREDHRHDGRRGAARGGRLPRLLPAEAVEAHRRHRRRPGDERPGRLPDLLRALRGPAARSPSRRSARSAKAELVAPAKGVLQPGDKIVSVDGVSGSPDRIRKQISTHRCAGAVDRRLPGHHARRRHRPARRPHA